MHRAMVALLTAVVVAGVSGSAETLRLPMQYEETSYTVHTLTGLTSDEKTKQKLLPAPVEIKKIVVEEQSFVAFVSKPRGGGKDKTETQEVRLPFAERDGFLAALTRAESAGRKATNARETVESTMFASADEQVRLVLVTENGGRVWTVHMVLADRTYVLDKNCMSKVANAVRSL